MSVKDFGELPFALRKYIVDQQAKDKTHAERMVAKRAQQDEELKLMLVNIVKKRWTKLSGAERTMLLNLLKWKQEGRNFTNNQRDVITSHYLKLIDEGAA